MTIQFKPGGATTPAATSGNTPSRTTGINRDIRAEEARNRCENAKMNVKRNRAKGTFQRNGMEPIFSAMWLVTANIRPDGTNAAASQKRRCRMPKLPSSAEEGKAEPKVRLGWCWSIKSFI